MHSLPPKSRASLGNLGSAVISTAISSTTNKKTRTSCSRFNHWLTFLSSHHLSLTTITSLPCFTTDYIYSCYAQSLINGDTINNNSIILSTILLYLKDAGIRKRPHPTLPSAPLQFPPMLKCVIDEQKRWQQVPNRREPLTTRMIDSLHNKISSSHPDSLASALYDWLVLGIQSGLRKSEWCQDASLFSTTATFARNVDNSSKAFISSDFHFESKHASSILPYDYVTIQWRFQKNSQNGQTISFAHDFAHPHRSPVLAALRIIQRAKRLQVPHHHPIAVFATPKSGKPTPILHTQVEHCLRSLAKSVYKINDTKRLHRYSCHSIRVGACVLLHSAQQDPLTIKFRLRWRSDSFMEYLRNTPRLAALHTALASSTDTDQIKYDGIHK